MGLVPTVAASAAQALDAVDAGTPFAAAVLDFQMPDVDGGTLALAIRARRPALPLVVLSSMHQSPDVPPGLLAATLHKPVKPSHLARVLAEAVEEAEAQVAAPPLAPAPEAPASGLRILVAEDNPVNQRVVGLTLDRLGYRHDVVSDGDEVLPALRRAAGAGRPYDVVLMDLRMPRMNGLDATREVREADGLPQPRVIAMTADVTADRRETCVAVGMDGFLGKPLDRAALDRVLGDVDAAAPALPVVDPEPAPPEPALPAADLELTVEQVVFPTMSEMASGEPALLLGLLADARDEIADELSRIKTALRADDLKAAGRGSHSLKTIAGLLDADGLLAHCAATQDAADAGSLGDAVRAFLPLYASAQDTLTSLDALLPSTSSAAPAVVDPAVLAFS